MKVILLKDLMGVGKKFEEKEVSDGYATNFLIPGKLAVSLGSASATNVKNLKEQEEKSREKERESMAENLSKIARLKLEIKMRANEQGHLFEKVTAEKVSEILKKEKGIEIEAKYIQLNNPIKEIGTFEIPIEKTKFTLEVTRA